MTKLFVLRIIALTIFTVLPITTPASATVPMTQDERGVLTIAPLLEKVTPGVVNISVTARVTVQQNPLLNDPFFRRFFEVPDQPAEREAASAGSGVIVDAKKGYVLTNHHVIDKANKVTVTLKDRRKFEAEIVGSDPGTDIALLKIDPDNLTQVDFGASSHLKVGDVVIAIGNPFGIGQTVTSGIVSALGRSGLNIEGYEDFIQTDASINPGNSGGALINSKGELIGINTAIIGPGGGNVGIGFAVPSDMARAVMDQLIRFGEVRRGRLGVTIQDLTPEIADAMDIRDNRGAIVSSVEPDSPAEAAGLKAGDVIIAINGENLRNSADLRNRIGLVPVGEYVKVTILRNGNRLEKSVTIERAAEITKKLGEQIPQLTGAVITNLPKEHDLYGKASGVLIAEIERGSPAWRHGLRAGDVIVEVNRRQTPDVETFNKVVQEANRVLALNLIRGDSQLFLVIQ